MTTLDLIWQQYKTVSIGKAADHDDEFPVSKKLIFFFMFVVFGSSIIQILNLFKGSKPPLGEDEAPTN